MSLLDRTPPPDGSLAKLSARQTEEDAAYERALAELDRLAGFALPLEVLKDLPAQAEAMNRLWDLSGAEQAGGFLDRKAMDALRPVIARQQEWNANVVRLLNGLVAEENRVLAQMRDLSSALVKYAQRILPTIDARDRLASGHATLRSELILEAFDRRLESLHRRIDGLRGLVDRVETMGAEVRAVRETLAATALRPEIAAAAFDAAESSAYVAFENRFRRSDAALDARFARYAADFNGVATGGGAVLDLGCGRGEFLSALKSAGLTGRGVESNASAVAACQAQGLDVTRGDLIAFLRATEAGSAKGVFAAQVAEHLPPPVLHSLLTEAFRVLRTGGLMILETVNPRSVTGLLEVFNRDLTHEKPLHPETLSFLAAAAGFVDVRVDLLSPVEPLSKLRKLDALADVPARVAETFNENVERLNGLLYGPMEYALYARR